MSINVLLDSYHFDRYRLKQYPPDGSIPLSSYSRPRHMRYINSILMVILFAYESRMTNLKFIDRLIPAVGPNENFSIQSARND